MAAVLRHTLLCCWRVACQHSKRIDFCNRIADCAASEFEAFHWGYRRGPDLTVFCGWRRSTYERGPTTKQKLVLPRARGLLRYAVIAVPVNDRSKRQTLCVDLLSLRSVGVHCMLQL